MKQAKRIFFTLCFALLILVVSGCSGDSKEGTPLMQLDPPKEGEQIAVMTTSMGVIKFRLFPDQAPKAVENFTTHAKNGYYDGLKFHRVINNFMIQSGDPEGTGMGGESIWGEDFEDEFSPNLNNFRGALSMANAGENTNGSQFFIVQAGPGSWPEEYFDLYDSQLGYHFDKMSQVIKDKYLEIGGTPYLDGYYTTEKDPSTGKRGSGHTVFGQVFEGMDVVDAIAGVEMMADADDASTPYINESTTPKEDVVIEKIEIVTYTG